MLDRPANVSVLIDAPLSVTVTITGGPATVEKKEMPRHKKNPAVGTKKTAYASDIIIEQADALSFAIDEEVGHCGVRFSEG